MVANLQGVRFEQVYPDNTGGPEFDTDGDGTATQEDEFVSFTNGGSTSIDISGWQVWSDSAGANAPDKAQDGLYHTFPKGTVLQPGETLYVINEISGPEKAWQQEASEGGRETGAGGESSNLLTEGSGGDDAESIALVNPHTGEFIVFNMSPRPEQVSSQPGFPGHTKVGEVDGHAVQPDPGAGSSYRYDSRSDGYTYNDAYVPCFTPGTAIATPGGPRPVEALAPGDLVLTLDHGPRPVRAVLRRVMDLRDERAARQRPIEFKPDSLGPGRPERPLTVSPQHRMLVDGTDGDALAAAVALLHWPGVRRKAGTRRAHYVHLVLDRHEIVLAEGAPTESFHPGPYSRAAGGGRLRQGLKQVLGSSGPPSPARRILGAREAGALAAPGLAAMSDGGRPPARRPRQVSGGCPGA